MSQDEQPDEPSEKKAIKRSKSFDIRNMFSLKSKQANGDDEEACECRSPMNRNLNRNHSQPESSTFSTLRKSILDHTQSMKKTTADFFGVNKEHEDENYQLWLEKRKRFYLKSGGKVKEKPGQPPSSDTNDSQHLFSGDFEPTTGTPAVNFALLSSFGAPKPSVIKLAYKGIKNFQQQQTNRRSTNLVSDARFDATGAISMIPMSGPHEVTLKTYEFDDTTADDQRLESAEFDLTDKLQETLDAAVGQEFLPNDLQFNYVIPPARTKTWTIVDRQGRQRINSKLIESIYDNSDRRQYGMGIIGRLLNRRFRSNLTNEEKKLLNSIDDSRPYFTYWIMCVQLIIMILALLTYGFGPFGLQKVKISQPVLVNSLSIQEVSYFEPNNIWLGPRAVSW